jgi:predicted GNAT family acetyltransferase
MADVVRNDPENSRYVLERDGTRIGLADYDLHDDQIVFTHTEVDTTLREHGLASALVQSALDDVRTSSTRRVVASCPYVKSWLTKHPEYQDLLSR